MKQYFARIAIVLMIFSIIWATSIDCKAMLVCVELNGGTASVIAEVPTRPLYSVDGQVLAEDLQLYLYSCLERKGCAWWYEYALCQAYQESRYNTGVVNPRNLEDKGLFQYKERYWPAVTAKYGYSNPDIFDPYVQIDVYTSQIAERVVTRYGDPWYMLSDHYTGGFGYNQQYVNDVIQWLYKMERIN